MESIYAALLLYKASKNISEANIEKVLKAAEIKIDKTQITKLVAGLKETDIDTIIKSAPVAPVAVAPAAAAKIETKTPAKKAAKKEEKLVKDKEDNQKDWIWRILNASSKI